MKPRMKSKPPAQQPNSIKRLRIWRRRLREPLLTLLLLVQIFILFVLPPLRAMGLQVPHVAVYCTLLVFVGLASFLSRSITAIAIMAVSAGFTIVGIVLRQEQPDLSTYAVSAIGQALTLLSLLWVVSTAVFGPGRTTHHRILGAIVMYLAIGMIFTSLDIFLAQAVPSSFAHLPTSPFELREALTYFSFSTLTTGSFGDILPIHPIARSLANLESVCGQLFPATLLARIVSLHGSNKGDGRGF